MRPTWAEVSLGGLRRNFAAIQRRVGAGVQVCAVVKADAYGHGAVECARALELEGAQWFGVSSTDEGIQLREAGIAGRILLMTGFWRGEEAEILRHRLTPAVWEWWQAGALESALRKFPDALRPFPVHLKVDTGMSRIGVPDYWVRLFLNRLTAAPDLTVEGIFTQLASADVLGASDVNQQAQQFADAEKQVRQAGFTPKYCHVCNSAAIASRPHLFRDMVRPGIALYGYQLPFASPIEAEDAARQDVAQLSAPAATSRTSDVERYLSRAAKWGSAPESTDEDVPPPVAEEPVVLDIEPVLSWKTRILSVRLVAAGKGVGYNATYVTRAASQIAVLPLGYGDGLGRHLSWDNHREPHSAQVLVRGQRAPIVGRVSMDLTLVDVTEVKGATVGDEVTILGSDGADRIDAWEHARLAHTIPYEILCQIGKRVPRKYVD